MATPTKAQSAKEQATAQATNMVDMMWGNWEKGFQKMYDTHLEFTNASLQAMKKQQELLLSMTASADKVEDEMKKSLKEITNLTKENLKYVTTEETAAMFESWNDKMTDIFNRLQQLSLSPSKSLVTTMKQSQEKVYESAEKAIKDQQKMQAETREMIEKFMSQVKASQNDFVRMVEELSTKTVNNLQAK